MDHQRPASDDERNVVMLKRATDQVESNSVLQSSVDQKKSASVDAKHPAVVEWEKIKAKLSAANEKDQQLDASIKNLQRRKLAAQQKAEKTKNCGPSTPAVARPLSSPALFSPPTQDYDQLLMQTSVDWASDYQKGKLPLLGLEVGNWGPHIEVNTRGRERRPGNPGDSTKNKPFSWNWGFYTILSRIPGGKATTGVLRAMCVEWSGNLLVPNNSARHCTQHQSFYLIPGPNNTKGKFWRIKEMNEEKPPSNSGPPPGQNPAVTWGKNKLNNSTPSDTPGCSTPQSPLSSGSRSSSSSHTSAGDTISPASTHTSISTPSSGFTPINRQSSSSSERALLPSSPTKRRAEEEDDDFEQSNKRRCME